MAQRAMMCTRARAGQPRAGSGAVAESASDPHGRSVTHEIGRYEDDRQAEGVGVVAPCWLARQSAGITVGETGADPEVGRYRRMARDSGVTRWQVRQVWQVTGRVRCCPCDAGRSSAAPAARRDTGPPICMWPSTPQPGRCWDGSPGAHRATELRQFLARIDRATPSDLALHLIVDNSLYAHSPPTPPSQR